MLREKWDERSDYLMLADCSDFSRTSGPGGI